MAVDESGMNKWVCAVMRILFTRNELTEGYVWDEDSTSKFKRLDPEKIELLQPYTQNIHLALRMA